MCGIAGFYHLSWDEHSPRPTLHRMVAALRHRGPDEQGFHLEDDVGLGHARLSIIDLSTGQQPMAAARGNHWVTFNGEIFNYVELQTALTSQGHRFRTTSDTETILHSYAAKGPACVEDFNGDFAFALWDRPQRRLLLARDRMGVRPLYFARLGSGLAFASEIKALLEVPGVEAELDPVAIDQCFTLWFPLAPRTIFKGIEELPPGHLLLAEEGRITIRPYWQLEYPRRQARDEMHGGTETRIAQELLELLIDATRIRLRADVPVGAYLSGGLDSSAITALIQRFTPSRLRTFSVGFDAAEFDETAYQQAVVQALGTDHASIVCTPTAIGADFAAVIRHTERPVLRTAPAPLFQLARMVRGHGFKVVLTGEGADEVLAGYDIFKEAKVRRFWARQPQSRSRPRLLRRLYPYLSGIQEQPQSYLEAFFRPGLDHPQDACFSHRPRWNMTSRIRTFLADDLRDTLADYDAAEELCANLPARFAHWHPLSQSQYLEAAHLLPGYILSSQGDRVAMAHAVEGRFPFLDHRVVEFAARIPPRLKLRGLREKHILRQAVAPYLPAVIAQRPKQPYRAPDSASFFGLKPSEYVEDLLSPLTIRRTGYFDPKAVSRLVEKCRAGSVASFRDNMALIGILSVQLLDHTFVHRTHAPEPSLQPSAAN
jgi:asparagine synthase (glutamine-hydrolysing)